MSVDGQLKQLGQDLSDIVEKVNVATESSSAGGGDDPVSSAFYRKFNASYILPIVSEAL